MALITILWALTTPNANALPAYSRLSQAKYGYRASCMLCHTAGGGSAVNEYGRDFLRAGANMPAFGKIEQLDSDGDGATSLNEILARSNPGDSRSTLSNPGDWLSSGETVPIPKDDLKKLFPSADAFSAIEGTLKEAQVKSVETATGSNLNDEDKVPTFYFALKSGKKFAVAQFVSAKSPKGPMSLAVAMDVGASVTNVRVLKNPASKAIEDSSFLKQFSGKGKSDSLNVGTDVKAAPGEEALSREIAFSVRKAVLIINAVFAK